VTTVRPIQNLYRVHARRLHAIGRRLRSLKLENAKYAATDKHLLKQEGSVSVDRLHELAEEVREE